MVIATLPGSIRADRDWKCQPDGFDTVTSFAAWMNNDRSGLSRRCGFVAARCWEMKNSSRLMRICAVDAGAGRPLPLKIPGISRGFFGKTKAVIGTLSDYLAHSLPLPKLK